MVNPDDELRRLDEALARLKAVADAEHHIHLEQMFSASRDHSWPPAPNTAHPSFERQASGVRQLIERGEHTVLLPPPMRPLARWLADPNPPAMEDFMPPELVRLDVRRCFALAPWTERPFVYMWRVAVESSTNRWVAGDSWAEHPPPGQEWRAR